MANVANFTNVMANVPNVMANVTNVMANVTNITPNVTNAMPNVANFTNIMANVIKTKGLRYTHTHVILCNLPHHTLCGLRRVVNPFMWDVTRHHLRLVRYGKDC